MASPSNRPSVGLAVVDSMESWRIKAFASHAQAFRKLGQRTPASARITRRRAVLADRLHHLPMPALFPFHMYRDHCMRRGHQQQDVKNQPENHAKRNQEQVENRRKWLPV